MKCLFCQCNNTDVIETRVSENRTTIRRRRSCPKCKKRYTTYERVEELPILVIKRDDRRERFDREKLLRGILKAVGKTTVTADQVEEIVTNIESEVTSKGNTEIPSTEIGNIIAGALKSIDKVAYIRFASVFKRFVDVEEFEKELRRLS